MLLFFPKLFWNQRVRLKKEPAHRPSPYPPSPAFTFGNVHGAALRHPAATSTEGMKPFGKPWHRQADFVSSEKQQIKPLNVFLSAYRWEQAEPRVSAAPAVWTCAGWLSLCVCSWQKGTCPPKFPAVFALLTKQNELKEYKHLKF